MIKAYINKFILILFSVVLLLPLYTPFPISANNSLTSPFIGVNAYILDYETNQIINQIDFSGSMSCINATTGYCSIMSVNNVDGVINDTISSSRVYMIEVILDNNYIGYFDINYNLPTGTATSQTLYVNGNKAVSSVFQGSLGNISVSNVNLTKVENNLWNFPIESYYAVLNAFNQGFSEIGINSFNQYNYPVFKLENNKTIVSANINVNQSAIFIFLNNVPVGNVSGFNNYFSYNGDLSLEVIQQGSGFRVHKLIFSNNSSTAQSINLQFNNSSSRWFIPIYFNTFNPNDEYPFNVSTDFALVYNLNNPLLDKLNIIANGNTQSNQSSSLADSTNQQANTVFTQEEQLVDNAENQLASDLQSLDIQNQNNNLFGNSKFIASASWVKTQFDTLTNNNAFGYLITFSLVIGLSLVIIGKLRG